MYNSQTSKRKKMHTKKTKLPPPNTGGFKDWSF